MAAVFGEAKTEKSDDEADVLPRRPVLFRAHSHSQGGLRVVATDLYSLAWHSSLDLDGLRDLVRCVRTSLSLTLHCKPLMFASCVAGSIDRWLRRAAPPPNSNPNPKQDDVGIAGSWSDFLDYLNSSLSSGQVRLLFPAAARGMYSAHIFSILHLHLTTLPG